MAQSSFTIGRVTENLDMKKSERGYSYVRFSIAEKNGYGKDAKTLYPQVWAYGDNAKNLVKGQVKKGSLIWISGPLSLEEYQRKDGAPDKRLKIELKDWGYVASGRKGVSGHFDYEPHADAAKFVTSSKNSIEVIDGDRNELPD